MKGRLYSDEIGVWGMLVNQGGLVNVFGKINKFVLKQYSHFEILHSSAWMIEFIRKQNVMKIENEIKCDVRRVGCFDRYNLYIF